MKVGYVLMAAIAALTVYNGLPLPRKIILQLGNAF